MSKAARTRFLERIRMLRKKAGRTQQEMAEPLGLNQATYSAMERGSQKIYSDYLPKIAKTIGIPAWQLFAEPEEGGILDEETTAFLEMWKKFNPTERDLLKAMAEQIFRKKELERQNLKVNRKGGK